MEWKFPRISEDPLPITLEPGDQLFMVGANGSGKSALIQYLVSSKPNDNRIKRISAHRQTWFNSGSIDFTAHNRKQFEKNRVQWDRRFDSRWMDHGAQERQAAVLFDLVAEENARARSITRHIDEKNPEGANELASQSVSPFNQLNELLALGTLTVSLENSNDEEILARHRNGSVSFSIAQMSDGERNFTIIAATVLTVKAGTTLLIDEPERHLHRSIITPFMLALFERRPDCTFVVSTHETALPVASPEARTLIVRSCEWNDQQAKSWDVEVLDANAGLPEKLKLAILGGRARILFVEGTSDSLDLPLYNVLFPSLSVIPKGSCTDVKRAVSGLKGSYDLHHFEVFGLIDRDNRSDDEIEALANDSVFALEVCSAEALYYCSSAIEAVACRQAESLGCDSDTMIELAKQKALELLKQECLDKRMAARRCETQIRNQMLSQAPNWKSIKADANPKINVCIDSPYPEELERFRKLVNDEDLDGLVARYPLRDSGVFSAIAKALKCPKRRNYEQMVVSQIGRDVDLAGILREHVAPLSDALKVES